MNQNLAPPADHLVSSGAKPFLKWAGGKASLLPSLRRLTPPTFSRYFEPFLGGGAFFFNLEPRHAILSDTNSELIDCYEIVRNRPVKLIEEIAKYRVSAKDFARIRAIEPRSLSKLARSARLIYLNKTCFNGLYRVNRQGQFNTPFGYYKVVRLVNEANILAASLVLKNAQLSCSSYDEVALKLARPGDFIYFDPPYLPISKYSDFKRYTASQFREADHEQLADIFKELDKRGCFVLLSNSFHPKVKKLYSGFRIEKVLAPRFINCRASNRGPIKELLISNY